MLMSYEIPAELQYKEKIVFGLTFEQLVFGLLLLPLAFALVFKVHGNIYVRIGFAAFLCCLAVLLMFFNFKEWCFNWFEYFKFKRMKAKELKEYFGSPKIENNYIKLKEGKYFRNVGVLQVIPLNFGIKQDEEKQAVIASFQKFLNSLEFPVQIIIGTVPVDLKSYFDKSKNVSDELKDLYSDYEQFLKQRISESRMVDRHFYIIIPEQQNIGLDIQTRICIERLRSLDLKASLLNAVELQKTVSYFVDNKSLFPSSVSNNLDHIKIGDSFSRIVAVSGYPRTVEPGFLDKIITTKGEFDICLHIEPYPVELMMIQLNKELQKQRADLYACELKGVLNPSLEIQYNDTRKVLETLQKGYEKLFNISLYVNCKAKTIEELNFITKQVEAELNSLMLIPKLPIFRMQQGFKSVLPYSCNALGIKRNLTTKALSAFFPFTSQFLQVDDTGVWFGLNKNDVPVIKDVFKLTNPNGFIMATSGSGKSYFSKLLISRQFLNGTKVIIVDPQGEYVKLTQQFNGQLINISRTSKTIINPLDLAGHDYAEKRLALMDLLAVMLGDVSEIQKSVLDRALTETYLKAGINNEEATWNNVPPKLEDLRRQLEIMEKPATQVEKPTYRSLINRLSMYVDGVFCFLNQDTHIDFDNNFVCFNIGDMPKQVKPVIMFLILDYVYMKMKKDKERKLLVVDEAWSLLCRTEDASYIFEIVKTCRKFNMGLLLITQDVADLLKSEAGNAVLANSSYTLLMRQKPAVIEQVVKTFQLSNAEKEKLLTAGIGEGILLMENEHTEIKIVASEKEHKVITTNPDELKQIEKEELPKKKVSIKIDLSKRIYKSNDLSNEEKEYLKIKGYVEKKCVDIGNIRYEKFYLKPRSNENPEHFFLVEAVSKYLRQFTEAIEVFETAKPDIVFVANGKKVAVEVESGVWLKTNKNAFKNKVALLNKEYVDWFFLVTESRLAYYYKEYGQVFTRKNIAKKLRSYFRRAENKASAPRKTQEKAK